MRLFLIGLPILLLPSLVQAVDCADLPADLQPISQHYVRPVLDRAKRSITYAKESLQNSDFFPYYLPGWARQIAGTMGQLIDSRQRLTVRTAELETASACLRFDQLLIECAMNDVRAELDTQLERGSFFAIMQLQSLMLFLEERLDILTTGGIDGGYADQDWETQRLFDREQPSPLTEPLCPFHSDYTPPRETGYGCDDSIMTSIIQSTGNGTLPFVEAELAGLQSIQRETDAFRQILPLLRAADQSSSTSSASSRPGHRTLIGCHEETGTCSGDEAIICGSDEFCASKGQGTCLRTTTTPRIPKRALRGAFSYPKKHLRLLTEFVMKRVDDGFSRTFESDWAREEDLPAGSDALAERENDILSIIGARTENRVYFQSISGLQGWHEAVVFPEAVDSQLTIASSLSDMRVSIGELSRIASTQNGLRSAIIEFAYFLRRTCAFRPCQKTLEQIIRIALQDVCFPYANGEYLKDSVDLPRWKICAEAACIQVDGANLSGTCQSVLPPT